MCRWFAYLAPEEECLLEDVLVTPDHALSKQIHDHYLPMLMVHGPDDKAEEAEISSRNRLFNVDGFGICWYTSTREDFNEAKDARPALYKNSQPPTHDANFQSICANTSTTTVFGHVRAATATPVAPINNHPFIFGRHAFMHNGVITNFTDIKREMLMEMEKNAYENIHGATDSEHLAALYMTFLTQDSKVTGTDAWEEQYSVTQMKDALDGAVKMVIKLQQKILGVKNAEANSLNLCVTDGQQMVAFRFRNHETEQPPSLYWSTTAGVTLNRKYPDSAEGRTNKTAYKDASEHGKHMIVASEPTTYKDEEWHVVPKNHAVLVDSNGTHSIEEIETHAEHMAQAPTTQIG